MWFVFRFLFVFKLKSESESKNKIPIIPVYKPLQVIYGEKIKNLKHLSKYASNVLLDVKSSKRDIWCWRTGAPVDTRTSRADSEVFLSSRTHVNCTNTMMSHNDLSVRGASWSLSGDTSDHHETPSGLLGAGHTPSHLSWHAATQLVL